MNKNDLRYLKTEKNIIAAFAECVQTIGFEKTTVAEICSKGQISRNTFYLHYEDKYDLLNTLYRNVESRMENTLEEHILTNLKKYSFRESIEWTYSGIDANREDILLLIKCSRDKMRELLKRAFIDTPLHKMVENYDVVSQNIKLQLIKNYTADAMVGYIETWLEHYDEISIEEIKDIMEQLCTVPIQIHFDMLGLKNENRHKT